MNKDQTSIVERIRADIKAKRNTVLDYRESHIAMNAIIKDAEYLQAQAECDTPQPLTLEQLKQRVGKPVYTTSIGIKDIGRWEILCDINDDVFCLCTAYKEIYKIEMHFYGKTWLAYDYELKEQVK